MDEEMPSKAGTVPLEGAGLALLQLRMGNFQDAERLLRGIVVSSPADHVARDRLSDVLVLRRAIEDVEGDEPEPLELAKTPAPDWLNKRGPRASPEGWAAAAPSKGASQSSSASWGDDEDGSTSVIRPDEEAELHMKSGHPERAIEIYEMLITRYPDKPRFRARLDEVRAMAARAVPVAPAPPAMPAAPAATAAPPPAVEEHAFGDFETDEMTSVEPWRAPPPRPPAAPIAGTSTSVVNVVPIRPIVRVR
jgi:hypothetical protein